MDTNRETEAKLHDLVRIGGYILRRQEPPYGRETFELIMEASRTANPRPLLDKIVGEYAGLGRSQLIVDTKIIPKIGKSVRHRQIQRN
jgi:hypothetical protein